MKDIKSMELKELSGLMAELGEPGFRAKQVFSWIHEKKTAAFDEMTSLPKSLRERLAGMFYISGAEILGKYVSKADGTVKYLFAFEKDTIIESVLMKYEYGAAVCVSTQAGCAMGCTFCASTLGGMSRNLSAGEMLSQVYEASRDSGETVNHVVLMGSGEPLDNYGEVMKFIRIINAAEGMNLGQRKITLSTCGLADMIEKLADEELQITLAVSLHAPDDVIRNKIMPISRKYPMGELLAACERYAQRTGRRVTFEYALIKGVNDSDECAEKLAVRLKNMLCHVNLIPVNDVAERRYEKSGENRIAAFAAILRAGGINATVRRELGSDINAACGQLRKRHLK